MQIVEEAKKRGYGNRKCLIDAIKITRERRKTMNRKQFILIIIFAMLAAFGGAFMASSLLNVSDASAQVTYLDGVRSRQFILVDHTGKYRAELLVDARGPALLQFFGQQGNVGLQLGVDQNGFPFIRDGSGRSLIGSGQNKNQSGQKSNNPPIGQWIPMKPMK
jgi:hypothetical protein